MKNLKLSALMIVCALTLVFSACQKETSVSTQQTSSRPTTSVNSASSPTPATVIHFDFTINYPDIFGNVGFWNPCTNDSMYAVAGSLLFHFNYSIRGDRVNVTFHFSSQGVTLVGSSGIKYQMINYSNSSNTSQGEDGILPDKFTVTDNGQWKFVSPGGNTFFLITPGVFHVTINANGVLTVDHTTNRPVITCP